MSVASVSDLPANTMTEPPAAPPAESDDGYVARKRGFWFWAAAAWLVFIVLCMLFSKWFPGLAEPRERVGSPRIGPGTEFLFGTNNSGHSVFARTLHGARISMGVAVVATFGGLVMGGIVGLISGYYRKGIDTVMTSLVNVMLAVPGLVLALALVGFFAPSGGFDDQRFLFFTVSPNTNATLWATIALAILATPSISRVARAQTLVWSDRDFVLASRTLGARNLRIILRDVLPNVLPAMFSFALIGVAALIVVQAALAFFGIGDVTAASWGADINFGRGELEDHPHIVFFPSLFMFLTVLSLNYLSDKFIELNAVKEAGV